MLDWALNIVKTYPELLAVAGGLIISMAATQAAYMWFYPEKWTQRDCFQTTAIGDFLLCALFTSNLWHSLDHDHDSRLLISVVSIGLGLTAPLIHSVILRFVMHRYPWLEPESKPGI